MQAAHRAGRILTYTNPLADEEDGGAPDVEVAERLMPPLPHLTIDRILRHAAGRVGGKARAGLKSPALACHWVWVWVWVWMCCAVQKRFILHLPWTRDLNHCPLHCVMRTTSSW